MDSQIDIYESVEVKIGFTEPEYANIYTVQIITITVKQCEPETIEYRKGSPTIGPLSYQISIDEELVLTAPVYGI